LVTHWCLAWILADQGEKDRPKRQHAKDEFEKFLELSDGPVKTNETEAALEHIQ